MTHNQFEAFNHLISTWLNHQDLRQAEAPIADLAASRTRVDSARRVARRAH